MFLVSDKKGFPMMGSPALPRALKTELWELKFVWKSGAAADRECAHATPMASEPSPLPARQTGNGEKPKNHDASLLGDVTD